MSLEVRDDRFLSVVGDTVELEQLATGFKFTEGPIWHPAGEYLIFSDIPDDHMRRWSKTDGVQTFRKPSNMANGNVYDRDWRIITCEHSTSRVTRKEADGTKTVLASHFEGKELNSPNDLVVDRQGTIFFTDPVYGRLDYYGVARDQDLDFQGVYAVSADGSKLRLLTSDFAQPNGLCFSLDETSLFINDTERGHIRRFDVQAGGAVSGGEVWAELKGTGDGAPDGLKIDSDGNLYCCGPGGLHVFAPDKTCLGIIKTPEVAANVNWGGGDLRSLFITASTSLYRCQIKTAGIGKR